MLSNLRHSSISTYGPERFVRVVANVTNLTHESAAITLINASKLCHTPRMMMEAE